MATISSAAAQRVPDPSSWRPQGNREFPAHARLHEIFESRALENPGKTAVSAGDISISYGELNTRGNRLARALRETGIGPEQRVGLLVRPTVETIVGIIGILKAGGAYVPIDPDYPPTRISYLLRDSAVSAIVAAGETGNALANWTGPVISIDQDESCDLESEEQFAPAGTENAANLAYIIYTSGSTGTPKGVMVEHRNVVRLFQQTDQWFHFSDSDVWPLLHSISFDFSVWEIWGALLYGGRLVIVSDIVRRSPLALISLLQAERVTVLNQTPSAFRQLLSAELAQENIGKTSLRLIIFGGEKLETKLLEPWIARYGDQCPELVNMYGITETTVHVTYKRVFRNDLEAAPASPIGVPISDLQVHLLDEAQRPVPPGTAGEIYVSGPGVARGYWNLPVFTAERFITVSGVRMYRSGDRAIYSDTGELFYLGRNDGQIKVRGYRIEPGEIESCLSRNPLVGTALVVPVDYGDGDTRIEAYVVAVPGVELTNSATQQLKEELTEAARKDLPSHLRPSAYHFISKIPMTEHGKADRKALRRMGNLAPETQTPSVGTITATEKTILEIVEDVLRRNGIKLADDFFDIGATSLALTRILLQINQKLGVKLTGPELAGEASVSALAACVDAQLGARSTDSVA
jgi:amino acid adenylation domain-containing protein